jgi:hypothetical protein
MQEVCALGLCNRAAAYYHLGQRAEEQADYLALIRLLENHPLPKKQSGCCGRSKPDCQERRETIFTLFFVAACIAALLEILHMMAPVAHRQ